MFRESLRNNNFKAVFANRDYSLYSFTKNVLGPLMLLLASKYIFEPIAFYAEKLIRDNGKVQIEK